MGLNRKAGANVAISTRTDGKLDGPVGNFCSLQSNPDKLVPESLMATCVLFATLIRDTTNGVTALGSKFLVADLGVRQPRPPRSRRTATSSREQKSQRCSQC